MNDRIKNCVCLYMPVCLYVENFNGLVLGVLVTGPRFNAPNEISILYFSTCVS